MVKPIRNVGLVLLVSVLVLVHVTNGDEDEETNALKKHQFENDLRREFHPLLEQLIVANRGRSVINHLPNGETLKMNSWSIRGDFQLKNFNASSIFSDMVVGASDMDGMTLMRGKMALILTVQKLRQPFSFDGHFYVNGVEHRGTYDAEQFQVNIATGFVYHDNNRSLTIEGSFPASMSWEPPLRMELHQHMTPGGSLMRNERVEKLVKPFVMETLFKLYSRELDKIITPMLPSWALVFEKILAKYGINPEETQ